jgi:hypothetical protein
MMIPVSIRRPFVWLRRFGHRRGYGVHSPFAFRLITGVINEKCPYYDYAELFEQEKSLREAGNKALFPINESLKLRRLLYRLTNFVHPQNILCIGKESMSFNYMKMSCRKANYIFSDNGEIPPFEGSFIAYIHAGFTVQQLNAICLSLINCATSDSLLVIQSVGPSKDIKQFWNALIENPKVGITFDLYDVGLVFFNFARIKQHYIVNF